MLQNTQADAAPFTQVVAPHPDRVSEEAHRKEPGKINTDSQDKPTLFDQQANDSYIAKSSSVSEADAKTTEVMPHPDRVLEESSATNNVQNAPTTEKTNISPSKQKGAGKTHINLSVGATDDERTYLDIGASERIKTGSNDGNIRDNNTAETSARVHQAMQSKTEEGKN